MQTIQTYLTSRLAFHFYTWNVGKNRGCELYSPIFPPGMKQARRAELKIHHLKESENFPLKLSPGAWLPPFNTAINQSAPAKLCQRRLLFCCHRPACLIQTLAWNPPWPVKKNFSRWALTHMLVSWSFGFPGEATQRFPVASKNREPAGGASYSQALPRMNWGVTEPRQSWEVLPTTPSHLRLPALKLRILRWVPLGRKGAESGCGGRGTI